MGKDKYYSLDRILEKNAEYNIIYGERSNGKTTAVLIYAVEKYIESMLECRDGKRATVDRFGIIRRWDEDFKGAKCQDMFNTINRLGFIERMTDGEFNYIYAFRRQWYLAKIGDDGKVTYREESPCGYGFNITAEEHYKSVSYPDITTVIFDEMLSRSGYLPNEFIRFMNLLSTIIRLRNDVKIFMLGNTINQYCPYFTEMGLKHIKNQKKGTIDIYSFNNGLTVAVEFSDFPTKEKKSNKYFAFDNPKLNMITSGSWEISIYPHMTFKYKPSDVVETIYVIFNDDVLEGNLIISPSEDLVLFFHRKTRPIDKSTDRRIYTPTPNYLQNYRTNILRNNENKLDIILKKLITESKVVFQDNEVGEVMNNYLTWCKQGG